MHYLILVLGECWLVLWRTTVLFLGDLGEVQCLGSSLDPLENMWEMILWCLLYQQSSSVSPSPCHLSCSLHSLDYSRWESERQEGVWEVFFFFFFNLPVSFLPFRTSKAPKIECALGGLAYSCHSWDPFSSPEAFLTSPLHPPDHSSQNGGPLPLPSDSTFFGLFTWSWHHSALWVYVH